MINLIFITLNCMYFLFGVVLINTIRKEFFKQTSAKIQTINSTRIFIPQNRDKTNIYLSKLRQIDIKPKFIFILPQSDILVNKSYLWNLVRSRHYNNITYLYNFFLRSYILNNYLDRQLLEERIYKKHKKYPILLILSDNKNKLKLFTLNTHYDFYDLITCYNEGNYTIIQEITDNIFKYQNNLLMLEIYILLIKKDGKLHLYIYNYEKYIMLNLETLKYESSPRMLELLLNPYFQF